MSTIFASYPIDNFSIEDKKIYLSAVIHAASADGFAEEEKLIFFELCKQLGVSDDVANLLITEHNFDLEKFVGSETLKIFAPYFIRDCVAVSYGDYDFADEERDAIMSLADSINYDQKLTTYIINAVINQMNAVRLWSKVMRG